MRRPSSITRSPATARLIAWANQLGMKEAATLLNQTLEQEYDADQTLTELAESKLNREAA